MKQVTVSARYPLEIAHPMHRALIDSEALTRADLVQWGPTETVTTLFWYDGPREAVRELLSAVGSIETSTLVAASDGTYGFIYQTEFELVAAVLDLVREAQVMFRPPVTFFDDGRVQFEAVGASADLSELYAGLSRVLETTIERVEPFRRQGSASRLTDRQQAALEAAVEEGYYTVPRTGDTEAVAAEIDCEPSTAGELIRKAEASVITDYVEGQR